MTLAHVDAPEGDAAQWKTIHPNMREWIQQIRKGLRRLGTREDAFRNEFYAVDNSIEAIH